MYILELQDKIDLFRVSLDLQGTVMSQILKQTKETTNNTITFPTLGLMLMAEAAVNTAQEGHEVMSDLQGLAKQSIDAINEVCEGGAGLLEVVHKAQQVSALSMDFISAIGKQNEFITYVTEKSNEAGAEVWIKEIAGALEKIKIDGGIQ